MRVSLESANSVNPNSQKWVDASPRMCKNINAGGTTTATTGGAATSGGGLKPCRAYLMPTP
eukprot:2465822-Amphidinium_carterae.1